MLAFIAASMWLAGSWYQIPFGPGPIKDINGVVITVGATVKLVGTVVSLNPSDGHYMGVIFQPIHPGNAPWPSQQANILMPVSPVPGIPIFKADGSQLIVGS
jgi:hypothetical protein